MPITPPYATVDFSSVGADGPYKLGGGWGGQRLKVWCAALCEPAYREEGSQSSVLCSLAQRAKTACHLLPMRGPFIPPIPLGENSL